MDDSHDLAPLLDAIRMQQRSIDRLVHLLEERSAGTDDRADEEPRPKLVDWFHVSGRERVAAWQGLARFVEAVVFRYNVQGEIRPCWWLHPPAVEELTALWHVRQDMYGADESLGNAMAWQDTFARSRERLRSIFVSCRDRHVDSTHHTWMSDDTRRAFYDAVREEAERSGRATR